MSDVLKFALPLLLALIGGGGGVWQYMQARTSKQLGVAQNDNERESTTVTGFRDLVEALTAEVQRLREDRDEDAQRISRIEQEMTRERDLRWSAIQHIRRLYAWIGFYVSEPAPPPVPEDLAAHVNLPKEHL